MEKELYLTDLVDVEVLQRIQDAFADLTGMASLTTDVDGVPVTEGSNFTDFCMGYTRSTATGRMRCEQCDKFGAHATWKNGKPTTYYCHAGLIDYAAPIIADGKLVGCFIGGQVLDKEPDLEQIRKVAEEIGVDQDGLVAAVQKIRILHKDNIDHAAQFLYTIANILSDMAYGRYMVLQANKEIEKAANMKSDFLANMSHEIRTPMNAVIGMAEMALREDLPPVARDYVHQIKSSGQALLTIINDILDFSKIESGKMDISPVEYEPMSIINDVSNILTAHLMNKEVELILDISPHIPHKLFGDNIRIKQVLLNIANNAMKFTSQGQVVIHMSHTVLSEDEIELCVSVEDTGIGIKEEDLGKLFQSFQQLDSKRNRNIEGTGLGLVISRQLMGLMHGELKVESVYGKGSTFLFCLPQKVIDPVDSIQVKDAPSITAIGLLDSLYIKRQMEVDCAYLGVKYKTVASVGELSDISGDSSVFLFMEQSMFTAEAGEYFQKHPSVTAVMLMEEEDATEYNFSNLLLVKKPLYTLNEALIFNREDLHYYDEETDAMEDEFTAPMASVLLVDDNAINLTVAQGLLEPLQMKIDTALSGEEAIDKISKQLYDIVFMDHMMPEMDGVEATHVIRHSHKEYKNVPIIALTANAVDGMKERFLQEGMDDFVAKPIEYRTLVAKVKQWLPTEKLQKVSDSPAVSRQQQPVKENVVGDLDTTSAIRMLGTEKLFWTVLKDYYRVIDKKSKLIQELMEKEDWKGYTIEVHALKSASRQIGAISLAEKAADMEMAGNARDVDRIRRCTDEMLQQYRGYLSVLEPFFREKPEEEDLKQEISRDILHALFAEMQEALDDLDIDGMESVISKMEQYRIEGWQQETFYRLKDSVNEIDVDACEEIIHQWDAWLSASQDNEEGN
ncbi:MAG: PocR ligand-binding domain-containing protein [Eubacteriales bacterium]|nr:PocR ligand-binding domain-containing protein [Eubacteriales bacterium]